MSPHYEILLTSFCDIDPLKPRIFITEGRESQGGRERESNQGEMTRQKDRNFKKVHIWYKFFFP